MRTRTEEKISCDFKWLLTKHFPGLLAFHVPNEFRKGGVATAARRKRMGVVAGVADWIIMPVDKPPLFIELKTPKGRLRPSQQWFRDVVTGMGFQYHVATSGGDALQIVKDYMQ